MATSKSEKKPMPLCILVTNLCNLQSYAHVTPQILIFPILNVHLHRVYEKSEQGEKRRYSYQRARSTKTFNGTGSWTSNVGSSDSKIFGAWFGQIS